MKENDPRQKYFQQSPKDIEYCNRITEISAQILNILAKYKCNITDFKSIVYQVT